MKCIDLPVSLEAAKLFYFKCLIPILELEKIPSTDQAAAKSMFQDFVSSLGDAFSKNPSFESLINKIKSPGGTTQAGLESLEKNNLDEILKDAFTAAENRSIQLSEES